MSAQRPDRNIAQLLTRWRKHRTISAVLFVPYMVRAVLFHQGGADSEFKTYFDFKSIFVRIKRRAKRYCWLLMMPAQYLIYRYNRYLTKMAITWVNQLPVEERASIRRNLQATDRDTSGVLISLIGASRKLGNPNTRLEDYCRSVVETTENLNQVEIVIRIDEDDDLMHYLSIKERYGKQVALRFVVGSRLKGYKGLHHLVSDTLNYLSPSSKLVFGFADDCVIKRKGWDIACINAIAPYSDNIVFVNTSRDLEMPYEESMTFFWLLWCWGPPALFSAVGRKVLEITARVAKDYPGWTAYGNSVMCDSFFESLQFYIWQEIKQRRAPIIADTIMIREDILIPSHKEGGLLSQSPVAINSYRAFLAEDVQEVVKKMAKAIVQEMHLETNALHQKKLAAG